MEKQDLDNLQQTTKDYAESVGWFDGVVLGVISVIYGLMTYFKIGNWGIISLLILLMISWCFVSIRLKRTIMHKGLGYVRQKQITPWEFFRERPITMLLCLGLGFFIPLLTKYWGTGTAYLILFLGIGGVAIIIGLMNRKKATFYSGVCCIIYILIWIFPMKHIFYAHENAPQGIVFTSLGLLWIAGGIINHFEYKNIIQKVKGTN
ncbi:MAG: hypothetical protein WC614_09200 [bacterium]